MNSKTLGLLHTSATLVPVFTSLCQSRLPGTDVIHIADDSLIKDVIRRQQLTPRTARRVLNHLVSAEEAGADYIMATCSSIGPAVEAAAPFIGVPVFRVDQPMVDQALQLGTRIGVVATLSTTLAPTSDLVQRRAATAGKQIELTSRLCEGAFESLMTGDAAAHDRRVRETLKELMSQVDVVMLAQASMSGVVEHLPGGWGNVPILTSPTLAIDFLAANWL